jgi:chromosome segregation ATPase
LSGVNKKLSQQLVEQQAATESELRVVAELKEALAVSERHSHSLVADIDELHSQLEHADRVRKSLENDLHDASERLNESFMANANLAGQKRKADSDLDAVRSEVDEMNAELKNAEERVRKAEADASRLANELANEQVNPFLFEFKLLLI